MIVGNLVDFSCFALIIASIIAGWSLPRFTKQYLTPASTNASKKPVAAESTRASLSHLRFFVWISRFIVIFFCRSVSNIDLVTFSNAEQELYEKLYQSTTRRYQQSSTEREHGICLCFLARLRNIRGPIRRVQIGRRARFFPALPADGHAEVDGIWRQISSGEGS